MTGKHRAVTAMLIPLMFAACQDARSTGPVEPDAAVFAANANPGVLPRNSRPFGQTYEEGAVTYRQWLAAIPAASNPGIDLTGEYCGEGQSGPVWFLASHIGGPATVVRDCQVPAGKALYVPLVGFIAWAPEDLGRASAILEAFLGLDPTTMTAEEPAAAPGRTRAPHRSRRSGGSPPHRRLRPDARIRPGRSRARPRDRSPAPHHNP
jgi:hypothetical protein